MKAPRLGLIGARRVRQGLGPFVARELADAGAEIPCVLGTREDSVAEVRDELASELGSKPRGYTDIAKLVAGEPLDALVILSPAETHESYLRSAAQAGLHSLCEKPLVWGGDGLTERAAARIDAFRSRGLLLAENCQWPFTLDAFRALHPRWQRACPERFAMHLAPASRGLQSLGDCLPHPLSLLQSLAPAAEPCVADIRFDAEGEDGLRLAFRYVADAHEVAVELLLRPGASAPRPAGYEIDGHPAERSVQLPAYTMELQSGERSVPLADPLRARLRAFLADLEDVRRGSPAPDPAPLLARMTLLDALLTAFRAQVDEPGL